MARGAPGGLAGEGRRGSRFAGGRGGRVYLLVRRGDDETALALEAASGKEVWEDSAPASYKPRPEAEAHGRWPRATPLLDGDLLYTLGVNGVLIARDAATGKPAWRRDFSADLPVAYPGYGCSASPLVEGDLLVVAVGGTGGGALAALEKRTGKTVWKVPDGGSSYSSPVAAEIGGVRQVVAITRERIEGVSVAGGRLLWQAPFRTMYDQNIVTPVVRGDLVVFGGIDQPTRALRVTRAGESFSAEEAWRNAEVSLYMSTPVLSGGLLLGMSQKRKGSFFCADAASGKTLWQTQGRAGENALLLLAGSSILAAHHGGRAGGLRRGRRGLPGAGPLPRVERPDLGAAGPGRPPDLGEGPDGAGLLRAGSRDR